MTKEELLTIPALEKHIKRKEQRLEYLRVKAEGGALQLRERVQTSPSNKQQAIMDAAADLSIEIESERAELALLKARASEPIYRLKGEDREVMILRYLRGLTWPEVAEVMMYAQRTVEKRHERILSRW